MRNQIIHADERGACGDGSKLNTTLLQELIEELAEIGGGTLILDAPGSYLCGTLFLKSNITLRVEAGATLLGSPRIEDYTELTAGHNKDRQPYHLIVAEEAVNVTIEGKGSIDGNGEAFWQEPERNPDGSIREPRWILAKEKKVSPLIDCVRCSNLTIRDVTVKTGGGWNIHAFDCDQVRIEGVRIDCHLYSPNSDGVDLIGCHDVMISNCYMRTCDDAIVLKTLPESRTCERVTVTNCILETACVALKLGATESYRDMRDICFSNCVVNRSNRAFALYSMAGATYRNIVVANITCNTRAPFLLSRPIHMMATDRRCDEGTEGGCIENVLITNLIAETQGRILIHAEGSSCIRNIRLRDIVMEYPYIEDPTEYAEKCTSAQFPLADNGAKAGFAKASVVAENVENLQLDGFQLLWPEEEGPVASDWAHPEQIMNGSPEVFQPDYARKVPGAFHAVWLRNCRNPGIVLEGVTGIGGGTSRWEE